MLRAQLNPRQVAKADHGRNLAGLVSGIGADLDDDIPELLGLHKPAKRVDDQLILLAVGNRLLPDRSRGDLHILLIEGLDDHVACHPKQRHLVRVQPSPHGIIALAKKGHVRDSGKPEQFITNLYCRIIAQFDAVALRLACLLVDVGHKVDDHHRAGGYLLDGDSLPLDQVRHNGQPEGDPVLDEHLGHVRVHASLECHEQGVIPVVCALR